MTRSLRAPRSQLLVAAVAFLLGLLVVVQIRAQSGGDRLATLSAQDLTLLVGNLNADNDRLRAEIAGLERQLDTLEVGGTRGTASIAEIRGDLERIRVWSGLDRVAGDGILITVRGPISAPDLEDVINELRNAGAEAIAIDDVRVVTGTVIGGTPGDLSVDDTPLADPFTIRAIGVQESLTGSLTRAGGIVAQLAATNPNAALDIEPTDRMTLPATDRDLVPDDGHPRL
ncbi:MAG TPA: DUF881 domain-containing protein [Candidatus Limnocylindrales bacterium]|nr:DUF881 domain-containing protein [Candidatus Limnocylindrales bacterium]